MKVRVSLTVEKGQNEYFLPFENSKGKCGFVRSTPMRDEMF